MTQSLGPLKLHVLHAPKEGNGEEQYEDAFSVTASSEKATVALSDGASSAVFAREWAILLAGCFAGEGAVGFPAKDSEAEERLGDLGKRWRSEVEGKATSWYAQEKLPFGSSATLLVVQWDLERRTWKAASIGDVCLFVIRDNRLKYAFPLTKSSKFNDRPSLVSTELGFGATMPPVLRYGTTFESGDRFLLLSDAWAAYFLTEWEAKRKPWNDFPPGEAQLPRYLKARRDSGKLKNDDVTLIDVTL